MPSLTRSQHSRSPVYQPMLDDIRKEVKKGKLQAGEWLASESRLGESYRISRISVRRALSILCEEGAIQAVAGKGYRILEDRSTIGLREVMILCPSNYVDVSNDHHYYGLMRKCISDALMEHNILVKTMGHPMNIPSEEYWGSVNFPNSAGVMLMAETSIQALPSMDRIPGPVLQLDHRLPSLLQDSLELDCAQEGEQMVDYLVKLGHTKIAMLDWIRGDELNPERKSGVLKGLSKHGLQLDPRLYMGIHMSDKAGYQAAKECLTTGVDFTAFITCGTGCARGVVSALETLGKSAPKDYSVGALGLELDPPVGSMDITCSDLNMADFAKQAVDRLLHRHKQPTESPLSLYQPLQLHIGDSTGKNTTS